MPNPQNTVQVAAHRAGESYLDTYELAPDAVAPATRVAASFGMTLPELFGAERGGPLPGQEDLLRDDDRGRITLKLAIVEADPRTLRALRRQARFAEAGSVEESSRSATRH
ncbi:MAG TPA: hypothetical protein VN957_05685 [Chthoniobacterales bacterium]|nr:hypothetical protein [Chthoniobacterales bacterium]